MPILKSTRQEITLFFEIHPNSKPFFVGHPVQFFTSFESLKVSCWQFRFVSQDIWRFVVHSWNLQPLIWWLGWTSEKPWAFWELMMKQWEWGKLSQSVISIFSIGKQVVEKSVAARYEKNFGSLRKGFFFASFALLFGQWVTTMQGHAEVNARLL